MFKDKENEPLSSKKDVKEKHNRSPEKILSIFDETLLNGLSTQDKELIRVLSYKNKNIAQMLQEKHTKVRGFIVIDGASYRRRGEYAKKRHQQGEVEVRGGGGVKERSNEAHVANQREQSEVHNRKEGK